MEYFRGEVNKNATQKYSMGGIYKLRDWLKSNAVYSVAEFFCRFYGMIFAKLISGIQNGFPTFLRK